MLYYFCSTPFKYFLVSSTRIAALDMGLNVDGAHMHELVHLARIDWRASSYLTHDHGGHAKRKEDTGFMSAPALYLLCSYFHFTT